MKLRTLILPLCFLFIVANSTFAEDKENIIPGLEDPEFATKEMRILHKLLRMEDPELIKLRQTIEHIEKMSPEEKAQLRARINRIREMPPEKLTAMHEMREMREMREKFKTIPEEQRRAMHERWLKMSDEERSELRSTLKEMTPEERHTLFNEKGILPPPPRRHRSDLPAESIKSSADTPNEDPPKFGNQE